MLSKNVKEMKAKKAEEARKNDIMFYRLMLEFFLTIVAVMIVVMVGNGRMGNMIDIHFNTMPLVLVITGILFALSAALYGFRRKNTDAYKVITRGGIFGNLAVLFFGAVHYYLFYDAQALIMSIIAAAVLYFTYNIFGNSILDCSIVMVAGFILLENSGLSQNSYTFLANGLVLGAKLLAIIGSVAAVIYALVRFSKKKYKTDNLIQIVVPAVFTLVGGVLAFVYPPAVVFAIYGLLACYLVVAITYTVKNM